MKIRLFVDKSLNNPLIIEDSCFHYLKNVLRVRINDEIYLFNKEAVEYLGIVTLISKKSITVDIKEKTSSGDKLTDIWLIFSLIKQTRQDNLISKAAEIGITKLVPVISDFSVIAKFNKERANSIIIESTEQSNGLLMPTVDKEEKLSNVLKDWPSDRVIIWGDEEGVDDLFNIVNNAEQLQGITKYAVLIGPEGGFSAKERAILKTLPFVKRINLGGRILKSDTAAIVILGLVKHVLIET